MPTYKIQVYRNRTLIKSFTLNEAVVIGRCDPKLCDPLPIALSRTSAGLRLVVASQQDTTIPRVWLEVSCLHPGQLTLRNAHSLLPVSVNHEMSLAAAEQRLFERDVLVDLGSELALRISPDEVAIVGGADYRTLQSMPPTPGSSAMVTIAKSIGDFATPDATNIANLLRVALGVVQQAAGSDAFFQAAVVATTEIVALDRTILLLHSDTQVTSQIAMSCSLANGWCLVAEHASDGSPNAAAQRPPSISLLNRVRELGTTVIHDPLNARSDPAHGLMMAAAPSLSNVECAVASPILNQNREVIGVLYGDRVSGHKTSGRMGIEDFEATLVEILAGSVAGGIARREEERQRSTLAEFFSPKVVDQLATNPQLMEGQDAEVSVLFCDIRGFSAVTEKLGPQKSIAWINDVMSDLSQCVIDRDGVLVDYVGDELLAMWGAPGGQTDHAARAIETAKAMMGAIETLRTRWAEVLPQQFGAGIGVNTGNASVGNVGSRQKFKYGPLGNTVNLGSRLQSATKQLGVHCVVSQQTVLAAKCKDNCRRIAKLTVAGIERPVEVYELVQQITPEWTEMTKEYQLALADFEQGHFRESAKRLGALLPRFPDDPPCLKLLSRAVSELDEPSADFTGVWRLTTK